DKGNPYKSIDVSDEALVRELPGFKNSFAQVNGTRLHYVEGGKGTPVILMPGWPQTWWAFHKMMPALAKNHHVIAVDLRGMGTSDKPAGGYEKKNMAVDIRELVKSLGYEKAHIVGHDIGAHIAYSYAAQFPDATLSTVYLDVSALPASLADAKLLPAKALSGPFTNDFYIWWFAFHQVNELPEQLIEGRAHIYLDWFWKSLLYKQDALTDRDRAVYANAYNTPDGIRGGNGWYKAFPQDLKDNATYAPKINTPSLGIGGLGNPLLVDFMNARLSSPQLSHIQESGHYIMEETPEKVIALMLPFLKSNDPQRARR
ncbi:alpha/beta fold hydrolase, partial [Teichococcus wenyumeiae]|uniref:alpha/beta fold hydrolase n=1 Tax=Teichococcus wenyumeiae TaxID=2478470 RepID=UPI0018F70AD9